MKKKKTVKKQVRKPVLRGWITLEDQDESTFLLTEHQKCILKELRSVKHQIQVANDEFKKLNNDLIYECDILGVVDTPQGTQFIKKIDGQDLVQFHYHCKPVKKNLWDFKKLIK